MTTVRLECDAAGIATLTFDAPGTAVNTMTPQWQHDLAVAVEWLERDRDRISGVLMMSAKKTFFAGAELTAVLELKAEDAAAAFAAIEALKRSFRRLETLGRPVVALLNGTALGGGWEVALAAHARFALDDASIRFGTPEVALGLIPGATGITKTVRLLGLMAARPYLVEGKLFGPREALALGLVDGLADDLANLREQAPAWIAAHPDARQPWDRKNYRMPGGAPTRPKIAMALTVAPAMLAQKTRGRYPAPQAVLETMVEGALVDYDTATRIESRKLAQIIVGQNAKNMISAFFFDLNAIRSGVSRPADIKRWKPCKVGVLGAGMMGAGIAHANAACGIDCVLKDVSLERAQAGIEAVRRISDADLRKGRITSEQQTQLLGRITSATDVAELQGCELIIEAVYENSELKAAVTRETEPMLAADGIFASNTSTLRIGGLARASRAPERFIGLHFFSPVGKMKLVEIIRGAGTDDATVARVFDYALALGRTPIVVNDSRGFFTSRVFGSYVMEGVAMLAEGIAAPLIEHAALAAGMPVGPLAVLDETSLSLSVQVMEQTRADIAAAGDRSEPGLGEALVERMVHEFNRAGRAAGGGFYDYPQGQSKRLWPQLKHRFERAGVEVDFDELQQRLLYRQSIETARCLVEGVLTNVHDANIGSIFGIGFPAWTGGALQFIASEGRERFVVNAERLAARHGPGFALSSEVRACIDRPCPSSSTV